MSIWRPYTQMFNAAPAIKIESAKGAYLYTKNGQKIYDGISSWWLVTHGHAEESIVEAITNQTRKLSQAVFANFSHEPAEELVELLKQQLPLNLEHFFFSDNGSTAVEIAMKIAYQYAAQSGFPNKKKFIAFEKSYHGDTCGAMSVSHDGIFTAAYKSMRFEVLRAAQGTSIQDPIEYWTASFESLLKAHNHEVCAVLIEPILQGAGGMIVWPIEAIQKICDLARSYDVLVIFDEVMTGFGRTGTMFAFEQIKRVPDLLCLSKGLTGGFLPMGLTISTNNIYEKFLSSDTNKMLFHGHSFTGNAISCAAAVANLKVFKTNSVLKKIELIQNTHCKVLQQISKKNPEIEARVCGSVGIVDFKNSATYGGHFSKELQSKCLKRDLFIRTIGSTVYLMPPYCSTDLEIEENWQKLFE